MSGYPHRSLASLRAACNRVNAVVLRRRVASSSQVEVGARYTYVRRQRRMLWRIPLQVIHAHTFDIRASVRGKRTLAIITSHTGCKVYKPTPPEASCWRYRRRWLRASGATLRWKEMPVRRRRDGSSGRGGGRLANVEGGRNVRIITRTPWNPWHRGDGKRDRQIRTIAGVSRTALSVMVVVLPLPILLVFLLYPSSILSLPRLPTVHPLYSFQPSRSSRSRGLPVLLPARRIPLFLPARYTNPIARDPILPREL